MGAEPKRRARRLRIGAAAVSIVVVLASAIALTPLIREEAARNATYSKAVPEYDSGDYAPALQAFKTLPGGFKDVSEYVNKARAGEVASEQMLRQLQGEWTSEGPNEYRDVCSAQRRC
jgi:hypothetical protein